MIAVLFWSAVGTVVYVYAIYPLLIAAIARRKPRVSPPRISEGAWPRIALLIPACNEERWIARKIENTLALDYPRNRMQIIVASDGSTDRTIDIARRFSSQGVEVVHFSERAGKTRTLNLAVAQTTKDIVVITDANALLEPDALRLLLPHFQDPRVGCVAGDRACLASGSSVTQGEGLYWRYESWIKRSESRLHSCLGAYGQLFAVRRELFPYVPAVSDDFSIPMKVLVATGRRVVFEPGAKARIPGATTPRHEWERKVRSHVAFLYDVWRLRAGLNPRKSAVWWQFWSHHVLRMFIPWAMLAALAVSPWLWGAGPVYRCLVAAQVLFYIAALVGWLLMRRGVCWKPLYAGCYFVFANLAVATAWLRCFRGTSPHAWQRTERALPFFPSTGTPEHSIPQTLAETE